MSENYLSRYTPEGGTGSDVPYALGPKTTRATTT
jgi:hypothetical protein